MTDAENRSTQDYWRNKRGDPIGIVDYHNCGRMLAGIMDDKSTIRLKEILADAKRLAIEYYNLTGRPLGITGEVAEYVASEALGLQLAPPRTTGYDAVRNTAAGPQRVQIKGRAFLPGKTKSQRVGTIRRDSPCDTVLLVLLDQANLDPHEMWEAPMSAVATRLAHPGSKARARGSLGVSEFKKTRCENMANAVNLSL